jgi:hypothetical protein
MRHRLRTCALPTESLPTCVVPEEVFILIACFGALVIQVQKLLLDYTGLQVKKSIAKVRQSTPKAWGTSSLNETAANFIKAQGLALGIIIFPCLASVRRQASFNRVADNVKGPDNSNI